MHTFWANECLSAVLNKAIYLIHLKAGLTLAGYGPKCYTNAGELWELQFLEESGTIKQ